MIFVLIHHQTYIYEWEFQSSIFTDEMMIDNNNNFKRVILVNFEVSGNGSCAF